MSKLLDASAVQESRVELIALPEETEARAEKEEKAPKKRGAFALLPGFFLYLVLLGGALLFTQALISPLSSILYVFMLLFPFCSLGYALLCCAYLRVTIAGTGYEVQKDVPTDFGMKIANESFLPLPYMEADLTVPDEKRVRCTEKRVKMSLMPFGFYNMAESLVFCYRGEYEIGITNAYVYDLFRMFRIRRRFDRFTRILILPRRLRAQNVRTESVSDVNTEVTRNIFGTDRAEVNDIRTYVFGDHMKNIHWKLSTKSEELMVKDYSMNSGKTVYLFLDFAAIHLGPYEANAEYVYTDDVNEWVADGIAETALALAERILSAGYRCEAAWYDRRGEGGIAHYLLESKEQTELLLHPLATAEIVTPSHNVVRLGGLVQDAAASSVLFITGNLGRAQCKELAQFTSASNVSTLTAVYQSPAERIENEEMRTKFETTLKGNRTFLESRGIAVLTPDAIL